MLKRCLHCLIPLLLMGAPQFGLAGESNPAPMTQEAAPSEAEVETTSPEAASTSVVEEGQAKATTTEPPKEAATSDSSPPKQPIAEAEQGVLTTSDTTIEPTGSQTSLEESESTATALDADNSDIASDSTVENKVQALFNGGGFSIQTSDRFDYVALTTATGIGIGGTFGSGLGLVTGLYVGLSEPSLQYPVLTLTFFGLVGAFGGAVVMGTAGGVVGWVAGVASAPEKTERGIRLYLGRLPTGEEELSSVPALLVTGTF